jgi:hypothetical protein
MHTTRIEDLDSIITRLLIYMHIYINIYTHIYTYMYFLYIHIYTYKYKCTYIYTCDVTIKEASIVTIWISGWCATFRGLA